MINIEESENWMLLEDLKFRATLIQHRMEATISVEDFGRTVLNDLTLACRVEDFGHDPTISELRRYAAGLGVQVLHRVHVREIVPPVATAEPPSSAADSDVRELEPPVVEQPAAVTDSIEPTQDDEESDNG